MAFQPDADAEEPWKERKKRDVLNLYKKLYVSVERRAPKTLELDSFQWNTNAMKIRIYFILIAWKYY